MHAAVSWVFAAGCTAVLAVSGCASVPPSSPSPLRGQPLPTLEHTSVGQVTVVKFFAKYCEPCLRTLPEVERIHRERPDVTFVGVAEDPERAQVDELISMFSLSFPVVHDPDNAIAFRFSVSELPHTLVTDACGTVRWVGGPEQPSDALGAVLDDIARQPCASASNEADSAAP